MHLLKIIFLAVLFFAPVLDIFVLDNQAQAEHFAQNFNETPHEEHSGKPDLHCFCHVIHHALVDPAKYTNLFQKTETRIITLNEVSGGLRPLPNLKPPRPLLA